MINNKKSLDVAPKKKPIAIDKKLADFILALNLKTEADEQKFLDLYLSLCAKGKDIYGDLLKKRKECNDLVPKDPNLKPNLLKMASAQGELETCDQNWKTHKVSCVKCYSAEEATKKQKKDLNNDLVKAGRLY